MGGIHELLILLPPPAMPSLYSGRDPQSCVYAKQALCQLSYIPNQSFFIKHSKKESWLLQFQT